MAASLISLLICSFEGIETDDVETGLITGGVETGLTIGGVETGLIIDGAETGLAGPTTLLIFSLLVFSLDKVSFEISGEVLKICVFGI